MMTYYTMVKEKIEIHKLGKDRRLYQFMSMFFIEKKSKRRKNEIEKKIHGNGFPSFSIKLPFGSTPIVFVHPPLFAAYRFKDAAMVSGIRLSCPIEIYRPRVVCYEMVLPNARKKKKKNNAIKE